MRVITVKKEQDGLGRKALKEEQKTITITNTSLSMNLHPRFFRVGEYVFRNEEDAKKYLKDLKNQKGAPAKSAFDGGAFGGPSTGKGSLDEPSLDEGTPAFEESSGSGGNCNCKCNSNAGMNTLGGIPNGGMARNPKRGL